MRTLPIVNGSAGIARGEMNPNLTIHPNARLRRRGFTIATSTYRLGHERSGLPGD